jgi:hypothetical protein
MEQIMNTPPTSTDTSGSRLAPKGASRGRWLVAAAVLAVLAAGGGLAISQLGGDDGTTEVVASAPLELSLGEDNVMASCIQLDPTILAAMSPAFAATATAVEGETVTLTVDHWYAGGDATTVELHALPGMTALIGGFEFQVGERYLITATEGTVNFCGASGPATPELTALFDQAFPS